MSLNVFELRELDELLRDFDHMLWSADSRAGTQIRIRLHVLIKRLEQLLKDETEKGKG
jgi:hypothetical protein